ncbi:hypothetical protein AVEN_188781-1 [Araneus ventricosus]|uniref:Uncharacterized protein n=1 Tax=Araneus ventricosus TaxID=182803 RepID=A0A4Y2MFY0_ARAVE|nr:hypothetical protein AVEN_188781-1 [Araneus ventricosus]
MNEIQHAELPTTLVKDNSSVEAQVPESYGYLQSESMNSIQNVAIDSVPLENPYPMKRKSNRLSEAYMLDSEIPSSKRRLKNYN